jgi:integrase
MIALLADSGLRKEELRRLRWGDIDLGARLVHVRAGKGQKDGTTFFGETTGSLLRTWLAVHPGPEPTAPVSCTREGAMLGPSTITHILHRLSRRTGLPQRIGPHALRHYAATSLLRRTGDLELVRRVLRHESLAMTLRYAVLTQTEVAAKFLHASPLDHLRAPVRKRRGVTLLEV